jgi:hypothetical protein
MSNGAQIRSTKNCLTTQSYLVWSPKHGYGTRPMTEHSSGMGSVFEEGHSADEAVPYARLRGTGLTQIICLMAWLECRQAMRSAIRGGWVPDLAPTDELSLSVLALLQGCELVVPTRPAKSLCPAATTGMNSPWCSLDEWATDPSLGAEATVLQACEFAAASVWESESTPLEATELWSVLARAECSAYLAAELKQHHMDVHWAKSAESATAQLMERLPMSQAFYICWLGVRDLASAYLKYPNSRDRLGETLRSSLEQKLARARAERWALRSFNRHVLCLESALARTFAVATGLGDQYLRSVPSRQAMRQRGR